MIPSDFFTKHLKSIDLNKSLNDAINSNADEIADITGNMLKKGIDSDGNSLGEYSNSYAAYKGKKKPVDLYDTGAFQKSIKPQTFKDYFEQNATDWKTTKLTEKYGDAILGILKIDFDDVSDIIKPDFITFSKRQIGL